MTSTYLMLEAVVPSLNSIICFGHSLFDVVETVPHFVFEYRSTSTAASVWSANPGIFKVINHFLKFSWKMSFSVKNSNVATTLCTGINANADNRRALRANSALVFSPIPCIFSIKALTKMKKTPTTFRSWKFLLNCLNHLQFKVDHYSQRLECRNFFF